MSKWFVSCALALFVSSVTVGTQAMAATQYVSDELTVPLRRGPSNSHKIIHAGLPSGTALEILGEDAAAGFTQVRTQNGTEGWVPTQYLAAQPAARDRLAAATKRIDALTAEMSNLRQGMKAEQNARSNAEGASGDLGKQVKQLQSELAEVKKVSADPIAAYEDNKALRAETETLRRTVGDQEQKLRSLESSELQLWLLSGGALVITGLILGVVIKSRPKSRGGW